MAASAMSSYASFAAILALIANVAFLSLSSQYLFHHLDPSPLSRQQTIRFNLNIACLLICCVRACTTSPGSQRQLSKDRLKRWSTAHADATARFCRKCDNWKPERWHHCKTCGTCIPKMDHHCVWLKNCISHRTFPHFIRFLFFSVAAMLYLQYFLYIRFKVLWDHRNLPHYLGPSALQLVHLLLLGVINSITLFGLSLLFLRSLYGMIINVYTIESWEIERHEALANRARKSGGFVYGPGGVQVWIRKQEYPFDIGLWSNLIQGFGSRNLMAWFWPLAVTPSIDSALEWERNGFEDPSLPWPPPDPDKMSHHAVQTSTRATSLTPDYTNQDEMRAFRERQDEDRVRKRQTYHSESQSSDESHNPPPPAGALHWQNSDGERLEHFGVDTEAELIADDEVPLSQLLRRR